MSVSVMDIFRIFLNFKVVNKYGERCYTDSDCSSSDYLICQNNVCGCPSTMYYDNKCSRTLKK